MKHFLVSPLKLALALAACGVVSATHAAERLAAPPEFLSMQAGAEAAGVRWQAVGDDVLSHQTGKAAGGQMVSGLVLDLMSQWQMPNGASATAHGKLTITTNADNSLSAQVSSSAQASDGISHGNHYGNGNPNAGVNASSNANVNGNGPGNANGPANAPSSPSAVATTGTGANPQASATGGQNVSVNGVSQVTQVAGNGNASLNSAVIDFNGSSSSTAGTTGTSGTTVATGTSSGNGTSASATSASGQVKADVSFAGGGVALTLRTPAGVATQTIAPAPIQGGGSIAQLVQVAGNAQAVVNQLQLSVQTQAMSGALLRQLGLLDALRNSAMPRH